MSAVIAAVVTVAAVAAGTGFSIYQSQEGKKSQEKAMQEQKRAGSGCNAG